MCIQEYVNKLMAKQCTNVNELVGKTIKFIKLSDSFNNDMYIVTTDGYFFIGYVFEDYDYVSRELVFDDICTYRKGGEIVELSKFGEAIGADMEICRDIIKSECKRRYDESRKQRKLEYERLKKEFETENT